MRKIFYDTEFLEGTQKKWWGNTVPTIDLISIGMVDEEDNEYYAVSKEFNLNEAWNRRDSYNGGTWIRDNVLKPIWNEWIEKAQLATRVNCHYASYHDKPFTKSNFKHLLKKYGKKRAEIAEEVFQFVNKDELSIEKANYHNVQYDTKELITYYGAYDHVVLCWLFGKMINLPKGFPMYSTDLKQMMIDTTVEPPKSHMEHNALADAKWNKQLYELLR